VTRALLIAAVSLFGCALQTFTPVQPTFRTMDISAAYQRAVQAVAEHCGRVDTVRQLVNAGLSETARRLEAAIRR